MRPTLTNEFDCQWRIRTAIDATMEISFYRNYEPKDAIEALLDSPWSHYVSYKASLDGLLETRHIEDAKERRKLVREA